MASSKEYLDFVLEQLSELEEITYRAMMGEYILYYRGKIIGGIYDDICSQIGAKILRLPSVAQDDSLGELPDKLKFDIYFCIFAASCSSMDRSLGSRSSRTPSRSRERHCPICLPEKPSAIRSLPLIARSFTRRQASSF